MYGASAKMEIQMHRDSKFGNDSGSMPLNTRVLSK